MTGLRVSVAPTARLTGLFSDMPVTATETSVFIPLVIKLIPSLISLAIELARPLGSRIPLTIVIASGL